MIVNRLSRNLLFSLGLVGFVALTNRHPDPRNDAAIIRAIAPDTDHYIRIAEAAPSLTDVKLPFHHAQRFVLSYSVGVLSRMAHVQTHVGFQVASILLGIAILVQLGSVLAGYGLLAAQSSVLLALFALNPWAYRFYVAFPELSSDLVFVLGAVIVVRGLSDGSAKLLLLGQIIASLGRQTGMLLLPMIGVWLLCDTPHWKLRNRSWRLLLLASTVAAGIGVLLITSVLGSRFAMSNRIPAIAAGFRWYFSEFDVSQFLSFAEGLLIALLPSLLLLISLGRFRSRAPRAETPALMTGTVFVLLQPVVASPPNVGGNAARLAVLGLVPLLVLVGIGIRKEAILELRRMHNLVALAFLVMAIMSLHHIYAMELMPFSGQRTRFVAAYVFGSVALVAICKAERWLPRARL